MKISDELAHAESAIQQGNFPLAEKILRSINSQPNLRSARSQILLADALTSQGKLGEAETTYRQVLARTTIRPEKLWLLERLCNIFFAQKDANPEKLLEAAAVLKQSVELEPGRSNDLSRLKLCIVHSQLQNYELVSEQAQYLLKHPQYGIDARLYLCDAMFFQGSYSEGEQLLRQILTSDQPISEQQNLNLLGLLVKYQLYPEADGLVAETEFTASSLFLVKRYQVQTYIERKKFPEALEILTEGYIEASPDEEKRRLLLYYKGRALDASMRYAEAHAAFTQMNALAINAWETRTPVDHVAAYRSVDLTSLRREESTQRIEYQPVFMIGFPRSGTSLLDSILDTQQRIVTLSEIDGIHASILRMHELGKHYPAQLPALSASEIDSLRQTYFEHNAKFLGTVVSNSVIIDKMPLNILHIPLILMMFPSARFILSLRHPVDVCVSCYQQDFILTDEMHYFTDLQRTFERYRDVMNLLIRFRDELKPVIHEIKYEDLINDLDRSARRVFDFLNLEISDGYQDFYLRNRNKALRTPSRDQVTQPLYQSSSQRWKNYAEFIEPHLDLLRPLIERYGYSA